MMGRITRPATGEEVLQIENCPCCGGLVGVGDCGYSTFNPGWAECKKCKRKWSFACVNDSWDAGLLWNRTAKRIRDRLVLLRMLRFDKRTKPARCFATEVLEEEAEVFRKELEEYVIGSDKPKSAN